MPKISFINKGFSKASRQVIFQANSIINEYLKAGLRLTLRQLYYQFVARGYLPNQQREYNRLGVIINEARLAGLVDWTAIEDRGRNLMKSPHWDGPAQIIRSAAYSYKIDLWKDQDNRVEVWIEKQALEGVIESICRKLRVPYFSCKGYVSQSEMWDAGYNRLREYLDDGQTPVILHFGDHDPSGIDMTRDIEDRLSLFLGEPVDVRRLALNYNQVEQYNPPPNPAKVTDSRYVGYQIKHGDESWELDALDPHVLVDLISENVDDLKDPDLWDEALERERLEIQELDRVADEFAAKKNL